MRVISFPPIICLSLALVQVPSTESFSTWEPLRLLNSPFGITCKTIKSSYTNTNSHQCTINRGVGVPHGVPHDTYMYPSNRIILFASNRMDGEKQSDSSSQTDKNEDVNPFSSLTSSTSSSTESGSKKEEENNPLNAVMNIITSFKFNEDDETRLRKRDLIKSIFRRLANLSLQDYSWRSEVFKKTEADRRVEESLATMMGEEAAYVRPMNAAADKIGPLGRAEKTLVEWLSLVIEEEGRRARLIASSDGDLVRPMDMVEKGDGGPLAALENAAVSFLDSIRESERERMKTRTLRPKDVEEEKRGPLGKWEAGVVGALDEIKRSEKLRMEQSRNRGGEIVRPIDIPGPLGEMERWYLELLTSEKQRAKDREMNDGRLVRPKDASIQGPMGTAERQVAEAVNFIKEEETLRLRSLQRVLEENRPMERDRDSPLGATEAVIVGMFRAPQLLFRVFDRVTELMGSEVLSEELKEKDTK